MEITNTRLLTGATVMYIRADFSENKSNGSIHGICYSSTNSIPTVNDTVSTQFWDETFLYQNIYYLTDLTPSTLYYIRPFYTVNNTTVYGPIVKTYTNIIGKVRYIFPERENMKDTVGKKEADGSICIFPEENYERMKTEVALVTDQYMNPAGLFPYTYTIKFAYQTTMATAAMDSANAIMIFCPLENINIATILHEFGHYIDYNFGGALSEQPVIAKATSISDTPSVTYQVASKNAFGYLLGKKLNELSHFFFNNDIATTACHCTHIFPYTDYTSSYNIEQKPFLIQLHMVSALFNAYKGLDGFIGISNKPYIVGYYSVQEGDYYIQSSITKTYLSDQSGYVKYIDNIDTYSIWTLIYIPESGMYYIKNKVSNRYLSPTTTTISTTAYKMQISPSVYDSNGKFEKYTGNDTFVIIDGNSTETLSTDTGESITQPKYNIDRNTIYANIASGNKLAYNNKFDPRQYKYSFEFIPAN